MFPMLPNDYEPQSSLQRGTHDQRDYTPAEYATALLDGGVPASTVRQALVEQGLSQKVAGELVDQVLLERAREARSGRRSAAVAPTQATDGGAAARNIVIGAGVFLLGLVITVATLGSGRGFIAWGAMLWGAIQFCRGLTQSRG